MSASSRGARPDVAVAEYSYRHQAEFAAGFLREAGIPFRLQIDDAGGWDAGVTIGRPAVLWVRADDLEEARTLLGLDDEDAADDASSGSAADQPSAFGASPEAGIRGTADDDGGAAPAGPGGPLFEPLCRAERVVAGTVALVLFGLASWGGAGAQPWVGVWESVALLLALAFGLSAVSGQTIGVLKAILRALSGFAP